MTGYLYNGRNRDLGLGDLETINAGILAARTAPPAMRDGFAWPNAGRTDWHGTDAGYRRHRRNKEKACSRCLAAHAEATRRTAS